LMGGEEMLDVRSYQALYQKSPVATTLIFFLVYLVSTALSLPASGVLSIASGIIFGDIVGVPLSLLACSTGGTLAFLSSRYLLHDLIQHRFAVQYEVVNRGIEKDGAFFVFSLRMIPVIPFWLLNLLMGLTSMSASRFYLATLTGMVPIAVILVHFGSQIGSLESFSLRAIFTPGLLFSLLLLGAMPFIAKGVLTLVQRHRNRGAGPVAADDPSQSPRS
jgi:uncharacterized membrane protein YdjX (TVP38/TMEM64 family)